MPRQRKSSLPEAPYALALARTTQRKRLERSIHILYEHNRKALEPHRKKIKVWRDLYDGGDAVRPTPEERPWTDAAAIFFPLPRMVADKGAGNLVQSLTQQKDILHAEVTMRPDEYAEVSSNGDLELDLAAFRKASNTLLWDEKHINVRAVADMIASEASQVGMAITRTAHDYSRAPKKIQISPDGTPALLENLILRDKVEIRLLPVEVCTWDTTARTSDNLPFFSYPYRLSYDQLKRNFTSRADWYEDAMGDVLASPDHTLSDEAADLARRSHYDPSAGPVEEVHDSKGDIHRISLASLYTLQEVILTNIDLGMKDGALRDIVVTWHRPTRSICAARIFNYIHNESPIDILWWQQRHNKIVGEGTIEPGETLAAGVNAVVNQTIDAQTIRNKPTIIALDGSEAADDLEEDGWYPGQILRVRGKDEINVLEFTSSNAVLSLGIVDRLIDIYFRINHLGPAQLGAVQSAQRVPTDLGQSIMLEGLSLQDKVLGRFRSAMTSVLRKALAVLWQTNTGAWAKVLGPQDFIRCKRLIDTLGWSGLTLDLNVSGPAHSVELERQNLLAALQQVGSWQQAVIQGISLAAGGVDPESGQPTPPNPILQQAIAMFIEASQKGMRMLLQRFPNITDPNELVPDISRVVNSALEQLQQAQGGVSINEREGISRFPLAPAGPGAGAIR